MEVVEVVAETKTYDALLQNISDKLDILIMCLGFIIAFLLLRMFFDKFLGGH